MSSQSDRPLTLAEPGAAGRKLGRPNRLPSPVSRSPSSSESSWFSPGSPFPQIRATQGVAHRRLTARCGAVRARPRAVRGDRVSLVRGRPARPRRRIGGPILCNRLPRQGLLFVGTLFVAAAVAAGLVASVGDDAEEPPVVRRVGRGAPHHARAHGRLRDSDGRCVHDRHDHDSDADAARPQDPRRVRLRDRSCTSATVGFFAWIELAFPAWVLALSVYILVAGHRRVGTVDPGEDEAALGRRA